MFVYHKGRKAPRRPRFARIAVGTDDGVLVGHTLVAEQNGKEIATLAVVEITPDFSRAKIVLFGKAQFRVRVSSLHSVTFDDRPPTLPGRPDGRV